LEPERLQAGEQGLAAAHVDLRTDVGDMGANGPDRDAMHRRRAPASLPSGRSSLPEFGELLKMKGIFGAINQHFIPPCQTARQWIVPIPRQT
jgi:hypothetical protein